MKEVYILHLLVLALLLTVNDMSSAFITAVEGKSKRDGVRKSE